MQRLLYPVIKGYGNSTVSRVCAGLCYKERMIQVRLKQMLEDRGRTRYWLAKESGIDYDTLARIEQATHTNRIELRVLDALCRALQCQPGDLLVFVDEEKSARPRAQKGTRKGR